MPPKINNRPRKFVPLTDEENEKLFDIIREGRMNFSNEELEDAEERHPLDMRKKRFSSYSKSADYLFKCEPCSEI